MKGDEGHVNWLVLVKGNTLFILSIEIDNTQAIQVELKYSKKNKNKAYQGDLPSDVEYANLCYILLKCFQKESF